MLLDVKNLITSFNTHDGEVCAVNDVSFQVKAGECLGVVGESGSGKTQVFMSIMGLLAKNGRTSGEVFFEGKQILGIDARVTRAKIFPYYINIPLLINTFRNMRCSQAGNRFHLTKYIVQNIAPMAEHIHNNATIILLAVIP